MAGAGISLLLAVILCTTTVSAIDGWLEPMDVVVEHGTDLIMNCTIDTASTSNRGRTAHDIIWYKYPSRSSLDPWATVVNEAMSQLSLTNVTFQDTDDYVCAFPDERTWQSLHSTVTVASKPEPATLDCFVPSPDEYWCQWDDSGERTDINNEHRFTFWFDGRWTDCPTASSSREDRNRCLIPLEFNIDIMQRVRVTTRNALGEVYVERTFNRETDVVVNPPTNVELQAVEDGLKITWDVPERWDAFWGTRPLDYKLRIMREDCVVTNPNCSCWTEDEVVASRRPRTFTLRELDAYAVYSLQLAARYQAAREENWSEWSEEVTARTRQAAPSEAVQGLVSRYTDSQLDPLYRRDVHIQWTISLEENLDGPVTGYWIILEPMDPRESRRENLSDISWHIIRGIKKFSAYTIKVAAYNAAGEGPWSVLHVPDETAAPNPPEEVRAVAMTTTSILVEWEEPSLLNGIILHYTVEWRKVSGRKQTYITTNASQLSYTLEGLQPFVLYEVGVRTTNSRGDSGLRSVQGGVRTLEGVPDAAPADLDVRAVADRPDSLTLSWTRLPVQHINGKLTGYRISFCESYPYFDESTGKKRSEGEQHQLNVTSPDAVSATLTDLKPSTMYSVWMAARTSEGTGPDSDPVHAKTADKSGGMRMEFLVIPLFVLWGILGTCALVFRHLHRSKASEDTADTKDKDTPSPVQAGKTGQEELGGNSLPSSHAVIEGLDIRIGHVEVGKEVWPPASPASDPQSKTVKFSHCSSSGDSGMPSSPGTGVGSPDFRCREMPGFTEEDDVFLEEEAAEGLPPPSPGCGGGRVSQQGKLSIQIDLTDVEEAAVIHDHHHPDDSPSTASSSSSSTLDVGSYTLVGQSLSIV